MKYIHLFIVSTVILCFACSRKLSYDLAITNVNLFEAETKQVLRNRTVLISGDTIAAIVVEVQPYKAKQLIEGRNRLMIPGMIDTHTHLSNIVGDYDAAPEYIAEDSAQYYREKLARTYLSHGVTTIADMGQPEKWMQVSLGWQKHPAPAYPNLFISGGAIISDEERKPYINHVEVLHQEDAAQKVQQYHELGLQQVKLYWRLREPDMRAVVEQARALDINMFAHIDNNIMSILEALDMGVKNFEHAATISYDVFSSHYQALLMQNMQQHYPGIRAYMPFALEKIQLVEDQPELRVQRDALIQKMLEQEATLSTTIHLFGSFCGRTYFKSMLASFYTNENPTLSEEQMRRLNKAFDTYMAYIKAAHDKGLKLRLGTDCEEGGKAALSEMLLLHEAGFSMEDILQIATINGARALKLEKAFGSLQPGKKADMVIFEKDPFEDPQHLLSGKTIIKDGQVYKQAK